MKEKTLFEGIKPFKKEVLLKIMDPNEIFKNDENSRIITLFDTKTDKNQFYEVLKIGEEVSSVGVGDIIWMPWASGLPPFLLEHNEGERKFTITREENIDLVVESTMSN